MPLLSHLKRIIIFNFATSSIFYNIISIFFVNTVTLRIVKSIYSTTIVSTLPVGIKLLLTFTQKIHLKTNLK